MPVGTVEYYSESLETRTFYSFTMPYADHAGPPPYGVLLLLHGQYGNHETWLRYTKLARYVEYLPVMVVMPSGANAYWGGAVESWVMDELYPHVRATYRTREDLPWAVAGYSMGGFGAMRLGLKYPDRFGLVYSHSAAVRAARKVSSAPDFDLVELARGVERPPRITFDCGADDGQLESNRELHQGWLEAGLPHQFLEHPGGHTWEYWDEHVKDALSATMEAFGSPLRPSAGVVPQRG